MEVRKANIHDLMYVLGFYISLREEVFGFEEHDEDSLYLELVGHLFKPTSVFIVSEEDSLVTGFMLGYVEWDKLSCKEIGYGDNIYIRKDYRTGGTRRELIQGFNDEFKKLGIKEVNFTAVPKTAVFWEKLGFETKATIFKKEVV